MLSQLGAQKQRPAMLLSMLVEALVLVWEWLSMGCTESPLHIESRAGPQLVAIWLYQACRGGRQFPDVPPRRRLAIGGPLQRGAAPGRGPLQPKKQCAQTPRIRYAPFCRHHQSHTQETFSRWAVMHLRRCDTLVLGSQLVVELEVRRLQVLAKST